MSNILIYGWYGHSNIGDELMSQALQVILDGHTLKFVDVLKESDINDAEVIVIGGGSFLYAPLVGSDAAKNLLKTKHIVYAGIGADTDVHNEHGELLQKAQAVFVRSDLSDSFAALNVSVTKLPDLSFVLDVQQNQSEPNNILILPNIETVPTVNSTNWKHRSWDYYKSEFCQALDELSVDGWQINFASMCDDSNGRDSWAIAELISHCQERKKFNVVNSTCDKPSDYADIVRKYSVVLTQRYHGAVLCHMTQTPCVAIHHHTKLAQLSTEDTCLVPYYGFRKDLIKNAVKEAFVPKMVVDKLCFNLIRLAVEKAIVV